MLPFAELLGEEFSQRQPDIAVDVQGGGSTAGIQALANGITDIGTCSRSLNADEERGFNAIVIARDGLAVVVHPGNPVSDLKREQIRDLFSGRIRNWNEVGGRDGPIWLITREEGSGTREAFMKLVMGGQRICRRALVQESNGAVKELVRSDPAAIGYMSLGLVHGELKALSVGGVPPTGEQVLAGRYPVVRPFLFVVRDKPTGRVRQFIDFTLSAEGQRLLAAEGLVQAR